MSHVLFNNWLHVVYNFILCIVWYICTRILIIPMFSLNIYYKTLLVFFMNSSLWYSLLLDFTFTYMFCSLIIYIFIDFHAIWLPTFTIIKFILNHLLFIINISLGLNLCSLGPTLVITSSGAVVGDGETKVHLPWVFHILISDFGRWTRSVKFVCRLH